MVLFSIGMTLFMIVLQNTKYNIGLDLGIGLIGGTWVTTLYYIFELKGSQEEITAKEVEVYKKE